MKPDRKKNQKDPGRSETQRAQRSRAEDAEPSFASGSVPVWLFVLLGLGFFWAMVYLDNNAGGFNRLVYRPFHSTNQLASLQPFDPAMAQFNKGMEVYNRPTCVSCHQGNGLGTPGQFPPLAGAEWVLENDPGRLVRIVLHGMQGPVTVKGENYNNVMVPWNGVLNDEEIAAVLTFVRKSWGNNAPPVTTNQVAKVREEVGERSTPWTADELLKVPTSAAQ